MYFNFWGDALHNEHDEKMTRKYKDRYRSVKSIYPDVYKLPEEEIQPMTNIVRYQGNTEEETKDILNKYIKEKEPFWKEMCYLDNDTEDKNQGKEEKKGFINNQSGHENIFKNFKRFVKGDLIFPRKKYSDFNGIKYVQNNVSNIANDAVYSNPINYSSYGNGFSKDFIDQMLNDKRFQQAMQNIRKNEGGYVNNKKDRGGETNYGIARRWYPNEDIKNMTPERSSAIYYRDYWKKPGIDKLPDNFAGIVFDNGINQGQTTAVKNLQNALGVKADGIIGPNTLQALSQAPENVKNDFVENVIDHYEEIKNNDPSQEDFIAGWTNRARSYLSTE